MDHSSQIKVKLRHLLVVSAVGVLLGVIFVIFSDGFNSLFFFINGALIGFLVGFSVGIMELFIFRAFFKGMRFSTIFFIRLLFYIALVFVITFTEMVAARMIRDQTSFYEAMASRDFRALLESGEFLVANLYILFTILGFNFIKQMNQKLGYGVLMHFITGKFYNPIYRLRVILFMRIMHSEEIIEKIGRLKFHRFIRDIMVDLSDPIAKNKGKIYEYVEDEVLINWNYTNGMGNSRCIRTFFEAKEVLEEQKERYYHTYNFFPVIKGALHYGKVVRGEIGDIKSQVVLMGDVMNTTARILDICSKSSEEFLISQKLAERMEIPNIYHSASFGNIRVKGKAHPVELLSLKEAKLAHI